MSSLYCERKSDDMKLNIRNMYVNRMIEEVLKGEIGR